MDNSEILIELTKQFINDILKNMPSELHKNRLEVKRNTVKKNKGKGICYGKIPCKGKEKIKEYCVVSSRLCNNNNICVHSNHKRRIKMGKRARPLSTRLEEAKRKVEKLELQDKIRQLREKFGRPRRRRSS